MPRTPAGGAGYGVLVGSVLTSAGAVRLPGMGWIGEGGGKPRGSCQTAGYTPGIQCGTLPIGTMAGVGTKAVVHHVGEI